MKPLALLILLLAGCASAGLTPEERAALSPAARVFEARAELNLGLDALLIYARQPTCTQIVILACHDPRVVADGRRLADQADQGRA